MIENMEGIHITPIKSIMVGPVGFLPKIIR